MHQTVLHLTRRPIDLPASARRTQPPWRSTPSSSIWLTCAKTALPSSNGMRSDTPARSASRQRRTREARHACRFARTVCFVPGSRGRAPPGPSPRKTPGLYSGARAACLQPLGDSAVSNVRRATGAGRVRMAAARPQVARGAYWRAIATRSRSSGVMRWSASSASSPRSIWTQLTVPVKTLLSPS